MATTGKILITGCQGQLGMDLMAHLAQKYTVVGVDQQDIDISNYTGLLDFFRTFKPDWVIHTAAYTDVDGCEANPGMAMAVNADGTANVAKACARIDAKMLYYSTDYVFDGTATAPYTEDSEPHPQTAYGRSKLAGEERMCELIPNWAIMRISWVYGQYGKNFVKTIVRFGKDQVDKKSKGEDARPLKVVNDQCGNPTWTMEIARQTEALIESGLFGLFHATSEGEATWYQFARDIFDLMKLPVDVVPCTTEDFPRPAPRPHYSVLENQRLREAGINHMRNYREALGDFIAQHGENL